MSYRNGVAKLPLFYMRDIRSLEIQSRLVDEDEAKRRRWS